MLYMFWPQITNLELASDTQVNSTTSNNGIEELFPGKVCNVSERMKGYLTDTTWAA